MCEPFMVASMAIAAVGAVVSGVQASQQQRAQARFAEQQAGAAERQTEWEVNRHFESDASALGDLQARQAASGFALEGSQSDLLATAGFQQAVARDQLRLRGQQQGNSLRAEAAFKRGSATSLLTNAAFDAAGALTSGFDRLNGAGLLGGAAKTATDSMKVAVAPSSRPRGSFGH